MRKTLKKARKKNNLTQIELAKLLNICERHYQYIESGVYGTTTENWLKLYKLFNKTVPLEELMENTIDDLLEQDVKEKNN